MDSISDECLTRLSVKIDGTMLVRCDLIAIDKHPVDDREDEPVVPAAAL
jgi:hypothetical protein